MKRFITTTDSKRISRVIERFQRGGGTFRRTVEAAYLEGYNRAIDDITKPAQVDHELQVRTEGDLEDHR